MKKIDIGKFRSAILTPCGIITRILTPTAGAWRLLDTIDTGGKHISTIRKIRIIGMASWCNKGYSSCWFFARQGKMDNGSDRRKSTGR
jgi:hypothetical protein